MYLYNTYPRHTATNHLVPLHFLGVSLCHGRSRGLFEIGASRFSIGRVSKRFPQKLGPFRGALANQRAKLKHRDGLFDLRHSSGAPPPKNGRPARKFQYHLTWINSSPNVDPQVSRRTLDHEPGISRSCDLAIGYSALVAAEIPATIRLMKPMHLINAPVPPSQEKLRPQIRRTHNNL